MQWVVGISEIGWQRVGEAKTSAPATWVHARLCRALTCDVGQGLISVHLSFSFVERISLLRSLRLLERGLAPGRHGNGIQSHCCSHPTSNSVTTSSAGP